MSPNHSGPYSGLVEGYLGKKKMGHLQELSKLEDRISFLYKEEVFFALIQVSTKHITITKQGGYFSTNTESTHISLLLQGLRKSSDVEKKDRAIALALRDEGNKSFR